MLITSGGIFGYLSNAYQGATLGLDKITSKMQVLEQTKERLYQDRDRINIATESLRSERQNTIDSRNAEISSMTITDTTRYYDRLQRQRIYNRYATELTGLDTELKKSNDNMDSLNVKLSKTESDISDMKLELIETGADVGPVIYIAQAFDTSVDTVVKFFIFILIFVFDPLAITLVIATNKIMMENWEVDVKTKKSWLDRFKRKKKESMYGDDDIILSEPEKTKKKPVAVDTLPVEALSSRKKNPTPSVDGELKV